MSQGPNIQEIEPRLVVIRSYLAQEFPNCSIDDQNFTSWATSSDAYGIKIRCLNGDNFLLRVGRALLEDRNRTPESIKVKLLSDNVAELLRQAQTQDGVKTVYWSWQEPH